MLRMPEPGASWRPRAMSRHGHLAEMSEVDALRQIDKAMTLLPTLVTIIIGVLVGGLVLSVMQAILGVNDMAIR